MNLRDLYEVFQFVEHELSPQPLALHPSSAGLLQPPEAGWLNADDLQPG